MPPEYELNLRRRLHARLAQCRLQLPKQNHRLNLRVYERDPKDCESVPRLLVQ